MNPIKQKTNVLTKTFETMIGLAGAKYYSASMSVVARSAAWKVDASSFSTQSLCGGEYSFSAVESLLAPFRQLFKRPHWDDRKFLLATVT